MNAITVRKLIYMAAALGPAIVWFGIALFGLQMLPAIFAVPLAGIAGMAALLGLVSIGLSFFIIISLPIRSLGGRLFATAVVITGLACLLVALLAGPPDIGEWPFYSGWILAAVAMAVLAELWLPITPHTPPQSPSPPAPHPTASPP